MRKWVFKAAVLGAAAALAPAGLALGDDQSIANQLNEQLTAEREAGRLERFDVQMQVQDGVVQLYGQLATAEQKSLVIETARRVPGVRQVVNGLEVAPAAGAAQVHVQQEGSAEYAIAPAAAQQPIPSVLKPSAAPQYQMAQVPMAAAPSGIAMGPMHGGGPMQAGPMHGPPMPMHGGPVPMYGPSQMGAVPPPVYDHPQMPPYAWPAYAAAPNYAAVTYPKQYSPTAWPYIGPFYPYPQVPLGWRHVTLQWDDGWWNLKFRDKRN
jgi:hypothetical protein